MDFPSRKVTQAGWTCPRLQGATTPGWRLVILQLHVCALTLAVFKAGFPPGAVWLFVHSWACKLAVMWWIFPFRLRSALTFQTEKYFLPLSRSLYCVSRVGLMGMYVKCPPKPSDTQGMLWIQAIELWQVKVGIISLSFVWSMYRLNSQIRCFLWSFPLCFFSEQYLEFVQLPQETWDAWIYLCSQICDWILVLVWDMGKKCYVACAH